MILITGFWPKGVIRFISHQSSAECGRYGASKGLLLAYGEVQDHQEAEGKGCHTTQINLRRAGGGAQRRAGLLFQSSFCHCFG